MGGNTSRAFVCLMETSQAIIKRGDKVRLEVRMYNKDGETVGVDHDPSGISQRQLKVILPFRIDT
jgi:hypothetical protein